MTRGVFEGRRWARGVAFGALLGAAAGCARTDAEAPDVPRAGPMLTAATHRVSETGAFVAFADHARLGRAQRTSVARTLALHHENEASLQATARDPEQLRAMEQQLLGDTVAHLRTQLSASSWDIFTRSGLLPEVAPVIENEGRDR